MQIYNPFCFSQCFYYFFLIIFRSTKNQTPKSKNHNKYTTQRTFCNTLIVLSGCKYRYTLQLNNNFFKLIFNYFVNLLQHPTIEDFATQKKINFLTKTKHNRIPYYMYPKKAPVTKQGLLKF